MKDQKIVNQPTKKIKADTIVSVVLDMSGSMSGIAAATREGLNAYLNSLKEDDKNTDEVLVSVTVFDSEYDWNAARVHQPRINTIFNLEPLSKLPEITTEHYHPDGGTPLYDAIGVVAERTDEALKGVEGKPDVLLVVITDGDNNTSERFSREDIKVLIEQKQAQGWTPVYLGANQNAWAVGGGLGISRGSTRSFAATGAGISNDVFTSLGTRTTAHRMAKKAVYSSADASAKDLVGSYHTNDFFAGDDDKLEEIVEGMTVSASLGDEEKPEDKDKS